MVGALTTGRVSLTSGPLVSAWANLICGLTGALFVACTAYLAATFLAVEATHRGQESLAEYFIRRAIVSGVGTGLLAAAAMLDLHYQVPALSERLLHGRATPFVVVSALAGLTVLALLRLRAVAFARPVAALAVTAVIWGWAAAEYPYLLPGSITVAASAAPYGTQVAELIVCTAIAVLVAPSFLLLFSLASRGLLVGQQPQPAHAPGRESSGVGGGEAAAGTPNRPPLPAAAAVVALVVLRLFRGQAQS